MDIKDKDFVAEEAKVNSVSLICPVCGGYLECESSLGGTYICDTCDYTCSD